MSTTTLLDLTVYARRLAALVSGAAAVTATGDLSELLAATAETELEITGPKVKCTGEESAHPGIAAAWTAAVAGFVIRPLLQIAPKG